ncbi:fimbrial assembly family protein [Paraburkholderia sp. CNPSo 3272]|uniref:fimbrial assembly family protein n=1 Tax=Paraburkholderia sp. CNPSo 3272 TaxID=2940931 RepID=UPI0020B6FC4E|nr:fimbrial assembly family protein [Paraburkholderia sp. CNPSo 3272]MCP3725491.1 fimbrial assembly family protein [Paraburkholderia sp. CNPSo 3272]
MTLARGVRAFPAQAIGGFNLLPWRQRAMRRLLRRRLLEWGAAAFGGCACALGVVLWQRVEFSALEARRVALERPLAQWRAPLAEAQRLTRESEARRVGDRLARQHAQVTTRFLALADALASDAAPGVGLQQLAQFADETDLQASAADESAAAAWLGRLRSLPDVEALSVRELKRGVPAGAARERAPDGEPIRVAAHLVWQGASTVPRAGAPRARKASRASSGAAAKEAT